MNNDPNKRQIPVTDRKTGETRLLEQRQGRKPRQAADFGEFGEFQTDMTHTEGSAGEELTTATGASSQPAMTGDEPMAASADGVTLGVTHGKDGAEARTSASHGSEDSEVAGKAKSHIETLEQFIEYAYSRKGQRVTMKAKIEKNIAQNPRLDDAAMSRLLQIAKDDALLAVPRQLLLLSRNIQGLPTLRATLTSFVSTVMLQHPVFNDDGIRGALRNLPEGLPAADVLARAMAFTPATEGDAVPVKGADLQMLRYNAAQLFVTWQGVNRGFDADELSSLLYQALWWPAARELPDDNARLRALTEIEHTAGVGLACQRFSQQANEARSQQHQAQRELASLRDRLAASESQRARTVQERDALQAELLALRESAAAEMKAQRRQQADEKTHLQHALEQLRGRLVKRLTDSVDMLEVGLSALRKEAPRVPVMVERAEHVVDTLRAEIRDLREE